MFGKIKELLAKGSGQAATMNYEESTKKLIGSVLNKCANSLTIMLLTENDEIVVDLKKIDCSFLPIIGDYLLLTGIDESEYKSNNEKVFKFTVFNISAHDKREHKGVVTNIYDNGYGVIDDEIIYCNKTVNVSDTTNISVGDAVACEKIYGQYEINEDDYYWRCTSIKKHSPIVKSAKTLNKSEIPNNMGQKMDESKALIFVTENEELNVTLNCVCDKPLLSIAVKNLGKKTLSISSVKINDDDDKRFTLLRCLSRDLNKNYEIKVKNEIKYMFEVIANKNILKSQQQIKFNFDNGTTIIRHASITVQTHDCKHKYGTTQFVISHLRDLEKRSENCYEIPEDLFEFVINEKHTSKSAADRLKELIPSYDSLNITNYTTVFHNLLFLDELHQIKAFREYSKEKAFFKPSNNNFILEIENVFELRPSLSVGDRVIANKYGKGVVFNGDIRKVAHNYIEISFDFDFLDEFNYDIYTVAFCSARTIDIRKHTAVDTVSTKLGHKFLFPKILHEPELIQLDVMLDDSKMIAGNKEIPWFNTKLNKFQKQAVVNILRGEYRSMPYIIYGPPGTGKTTTLIETIMHTFFQFNSSRILVAAHSNSAANLITTNLIEHDLIKKHLVRVAGHNYVENKKLLPSELHAYSVTVTVKKNDASMLEKITDSGIKLNVDVNYTKDFRLVIGTCTGLGHLFKSNLVKNFTHVMIDEAGQCSEPESLIPISFVDNTRSGQVVIAGDPKQMPPVILSNYANQRGLSKSFLERVLEHYTIKKTDNQIEDDKNIFSYDERMVTKLLYNYRAVPSVLEFYNKQFYNSELLSTISPTNSAEVKLLTKLITNGVLPQSIDTVQNYGLYFVNVNGKNEKTKDSSSWYNHYEIQEVSMFLIKLLEQGLQLEDIGVITPYHLQANLIREILKEKQLNVKVGSIEEFQGQERMVILISTVRTSLNRLSIDRVRNLGFIQCPKRINVAMSRARALCVVFGKEKILLEDANWKTLIEDCKKNGTYLKELH